MVPLLVLDWELMGEIFLVEPVETEAVATVLDSSVSSMDVVRDVLTHREVV